MKLIMSEQKLFKMMKVFRWRNLPESIRNDDKIDSYFSAREGAIFLEVRKNEFLGHEVAPLIDWLLENGCTKGEEVIIR